MVVVDAPASGVRRSFHYDARMRYLAESFALGALRRGKAIAQFLGPSEGQAGGLVVSWVEVQPSRDAFTVVLHAAEDVGGEYFADLWEFPPADPDNEFGRKLGEAEEPSEAVAIAEKLTGAVRSRWVNLGVVQDEYLDYVRGDRSLGSISGVIRLAPHVSRRS